MKSSTTSPAFRLPPAVRAAALRALETDRLQGELAWMSWSGTVWKLASPKGSVFVKRAAHLAPERDRLAWLAGRWPVPEAMGFFHSAGDDWLLTRQVPGVPLYDPSLGLEPAAAAARLGVILRALHATPSAECPFGKPGPGHVLTHGDFCLPNVLVQDGELSGLIDVGDAGLGPREVDVAAAVWSLQYNFGKGFAGEFLAAYGWPPMTEKAIERLRRRYGR